jgi:hypothetical protein
MDFQTIQFTEKEINAISITKKGKFQFKRKPTGPKRENDSSESETEEEKQDLLMRKLIEISNPLTSYVVKNAFKPNTKINPSHNIAYIKCNHDKVMPIRYLICDHKKNQPLSMNWSIKCRDCKDSIVQDQQNRSDRPNPQHNESVDEQAAFEEGPNIVARVDSILVPLQSELSTHLEIIKNRIVAVSIAEKKDAVLILKEKAEPIGGIVAKRIVKYLKTSGYGNRDMPGEMVTCDARIDEIFTSLREVIEVQFRRIKCRVLEMASEDDAEDPAELLVSNAEQFGLNALALKAAMLQQK